MKRTLYSFSILLFFITAAYAQNTTVSLPNIAVSVSGQKITVPINVTNFNNVGAITFKIKYDPAVLQFDSTNRKPEFLSGANNGVVTIARADLSPTTPVNGKLIDLYFTYLTGEGSLTFNTENCELTTTTGAVIPNVTYIDGGLTLSCGAVDIADTTATAINGKVTVPINVTNFNNVGSITFKIKYDPAVVRYDSLSRRSEFLSGAANGVLTIARADLTPVTPVNGKLMDIFFTYLGGTTTLTFNPGNEITTTDGTIITCISLTGGNIAAAPANSPPVFTAVMRDTSVAEGDTLTFDYNATDPDLNTLTFALVPSGIPAGAAINTATGLFKWVPGFDQAGQYNVVVSVSDGIVVVLDTAKIIVTNKNRPPAFTAVMRDTTIAEGNTLTFDYNAADPDGNTITFALIPAGIPSGATINTATGIFSWIPGFTQTGTYNIVVSVSDGTIAVNDTAKVIVTNTNRPPAFTAAMRDTSIAEGGTLTFDYNAADPDGDPITFALVPAGTPSGATINTATGIFSWIPGFSQSGTYNIVVSVSDGTNTVNDTAKVTVTNKNQSPVFTSQMRDTTVAEGDTLTFDFNATDPEGDILSFALSGLPAGALINQTTGLLQWPISYNQAGIYNLVVSLSDGTNNVKDSAKVTVINTNRPPAFTDTLANIINARVDSTITFQYKATDPDGDTLKFGLVNPPAGAAINSSTGELTYSPPAADTVQIIASVSDGHDTTFTTARVGIITGIRKTKEIPDKYELTQNFPNPFNPSTTIRFSIPTESFVSLTIYNLLGQRVASLINENLPAATYDYNFNAISFTSGVYIYRIQAGNYISTKKMTLIK